MTSQDKIYDVLLTIKEDIGSLKADVSGVKDHLKIMNGQIAKHANFINTWKGKFAIIGTVISTSVALLVAFIKTNFIDK